MLRFKGEKKKKKKRKHSDSDSDDARTKSPEGKRPQPTPQQEIPSEQISAGVVCGDQLEKMLGMTADGVDYNESMEAPVADKVLKKKKKKAKLGSDDEKQQEKHQDKHREKAARNDSDSDKSDDDKNDRKKDKKKKKKKKLKNMQVRTIPGTGRIITSGSIVQGLGTLFTEEVAAGDLLVMTHPTTLTTEKRIISGVLSNRSAMLGTPFTTDFISTTAYTVEKEGELIRLRAEEEAEGESRVLVDEKMKKRLDEQIEKQKQTIQVREKLRNAGGVSYRTVTRTMGKQMSAEDALNERVKQGRDKFCW